MKKFWSIVLFFTLTLCIIGCGKDNKEEDVQSKTETYKVTFVDKDGNKLGTQTVEKGSKIQKPNYENIEGYDTVGWLYGDEEWSFIGYVVTENMTLTQVVKPHDYNISYELNGGTEVLNPVTFNVEKSISFNPVTRNNYIFSGWYLEPDFKTLVTKTSDLPCSDVTLYAKFEMPKTYTINYITNGGTFTSYATSQFTDFDDFQLPVISKQGCNFIGWYLESIYATRVYTASDLPKENVTLYALFSECNHSYINGFCDYCGEKCQHEYVRGVCSICGQKDPDYNGFEPGLSCANDPDNELCDYVDTWEWEYNRLGFDGKGMEIVLLSGASEEDDPFHAQYTGERKLEKQKQITLIELAYNIDIVIINYPDSAAWGPARVAWINDNAAAGTLLQQGHIFTISSDWVPTLKSGNSIAALEHMKLKNGIFSQLGYNQTKEKNNQFSVGAQVYGYSSNDIHADYFLYYNQQLVEDYGLEDPATLWNEGRWDWTHFYNYLVVAQEAFDVSSGSDKKYAFGGFGLDVPRGMLAARGHKLIDNEAGTVMFTNPNTIQMYNDLRTIYSEGMWAPSVGSDITNAFYSGNQLFSSGKIWFLSSPQRFKDQCDFPIGMVPYPTADGAAKPWYEIVEGYLLPMGADTGYVFPNVSNGKNGLSTAVLVNIMDDISRGLVPEFDLNDMSPRDQYIAYLAKRISGNEEIVEQILTAVMSVEDKLNLYGYTDYMDVVSKTVGGGNDWSGDGFGTWGLSLITNLDVNPQATLESKKSIYQRALDEILAM